MDDIHRILVVDDVEPNLLLLSATTAALGYEVEVARDGTEALAKLPLDIDLILLAVLTPDLDGFEVARRIRAHPRHGHLPIVFATALDGHEDRVRAVEAGASDFLALPVDEIELRVRLASLLHLKDAQDELRRSRAELASIVERRTVALRRALETAAAAQREAHAAHIDSIHRLVLAAGFRDQGTADHIRRIGAYVAILAGALGLAPEEVQTLTHAAPLHDVGKIGIPDSILLKKGPLTEEERAIMQTHTVIGGHILAGSVSPVVRTGEIIALTHHERWDGKGYPCGLAGERIPLAGRICAVVDVFDALTFDRPYRTHLTSAQALALMSEDRGRHFDPDLFDHFVDAIDEILAAQAEMSGAATSFFAAARLPIRRRSVG